MSEATINQNSSEVSKDSSRASRLEPRFVYAEKSSKQKNLSARGKRKLHQKPDDDLSLIDTKVQKATKAVGEGLKQTSESTGSIFSSSFKQLKSWYNKLNSPEGKSSGTKKVVTGVLSGFFFLSAVKSSFGFFRSLFNKNVKTNSLLKFADAGIKWIMGLGIFRAFTGSKKGFKFDNLNTLLMGSGLSLAFSQLSGMNEGKRNLLRNLSKAGGVEDTLQKVSGYTPMPDFSNSMSSINPRGT